MITQSEDISFAWSCFRKGATSTAALCLTAVLVACGGGGDGAFSSNSGVPASIDQGRWVNSVVTPGYTGIVQHKTNVASTLWMLANDASSLTKLSLSGTGSGATSGSATGKTFALGTTNSSVVSGSFSSSGKALTLNQILTTQPAALELTASDSMTAAVTTAPAVGNWSASATGLKVNWIINAAGAIIGTSTTGCTYSGQLSPAAGIGLYEASFTETCASVVSAYGGIATINPNGTQMTAVTTTADDTKAAVLFLSKVN